LSSNPLKAVNIFFEAETFEFSGLSLEVIFWFGLGDIVAVVVVVDDEVVVDSVSVVDCVCVLVDDFGEDF